MVTVGAVDDGGCAETVIIAVAEALPPVPAAVAV
jgi:hypothetical protein